MIDNNTHDSLMQARDTILDALVAEQSKRNSNHDWEHAERIAVTVAANAFAKDHGLTIITAFDVENIEHLAMGHFDYSSKLALYVAELIHGLTPWP